MKRPDVAMRNKLNNPMSNPHTVEKMRASLTGKKLPQEVKDKMSATRKKLIADNPNLISNMLEATESKYLSKIRGTSWRMVRIKALERDSYRCTICGDDSYRRLLVHHIDWHGKGLKAADMNNDLNNLQTLCHKCHNGIHRHKSNDYQSRKSKIAP